VDCEKFETLLIDELYGELDEVTSAAVRRHAAGCARCGALLSGLRATRKVAALPVEEPSADLEDRILSAVREQQKVLPFRARAAMAISRAGAWAMRPQTAMAAVFLVVIGTSFVLVQSRKSAPQAAANAEGAPVAASAAPTAMASALALESRESAFAHGVVEQKEAPGHLAPAAPSLAMNEPSVDGLLDKAKDEEKLKNDDLAANAQTIAGAGDQSATLGASRAGGSGGGAAGPRAQAEASEAPKPTGGSFREAQSAYDTRRYDDARSQWDQLAPTDPNASLWAGRAERAKAGCDQAALTRFESARSRTTPGSTVWNDATLEAARCYRDLGDTATARARYAALLSQQQSSYSAIAQNELNQLTPLAARKAAAPAHHSVATATAAPQAAPPAQSDAQRKAGY